MQQHTLATSGVIRYKYDRILCRRFASHELTKKMDESVPPILRVANLSEEQRQKRLKFLEAEKDWDDLVQWVILSEEEKKIVKAHKQAVLNGQLTYEDPKTKYKVMTRLKHYLRGTCCGNACRHVSSCFRVVNSSNSTQNFFFQVCL